MDEAERVARGESQRQAASNARRDFGNFGLVHELTQDMWAGVWFDRLRQDTRFGLRGLWRTPAFTVIAVLCLAVGIGANAAVFSWTEGILFRPFPDVASQDRLVVVAGTVKGTAGYGPLSWPDFQDLNRLSTGFSAFIADKITGATITGGTRADRAIGEIVSANYFSALGVPLARGRGFLPGEDFGNGAHPVVVISYAMWRDRFGLNPGIIGKSIDFNGVPHVIVGVASRRFAGTFVGYAMQFWVPASMQSTFSGRYELDDRRAQWIEGFAVLDAGVSRTQAQASLSVAMQRLDHAFPDVERGRGIRVLPLWEAPFNSARELAPMLRVASIVVVFVLLVACANVANLLLVRSFARRHEMTVRLAVGAGRARLLQQMVTEALLLGAIATVLGLAMASGCRNALTLFFAPRSGASHVLTGSLDWKVLALSTTIGLASTLLFALVPAIRASDIDLTGALKADAPSLSGGRRSSRLRATMVLIQVAMSFALLVGGSLLFVSLRNMRRINPGFDADGLYTTYINLLDARYDSARAAVRGAARHEPRHPQRHSGGRPFDEPTARSRRAVCVRPHRHRRVCERRGREANRHVYERHTGLFRRVRHSDRPRPRLPPHR
jgi:predicted permease